MNLKIFTVTAVGLVLGACASSHKVTGDEGVTPVSSGVTQGFDGCCMNWIGAICAQEVTSGCSGTKTPTGAIIFNTPTSSAADLITPVF